MKAEVNSIANRKTKPENEEQELALAAHQQELFEKEQEENKKLQEIVDLMSISYKNGNGPTLLDVRNWKQRYGRIYISQILDNNDIYVWRTITRQEFRAIVNKKIADDYLRQEAILEQVLLYPKVPTVMYDRPAGVMPSLEVQIMFQSGFVDNDTLLGLIRVID